VRNLIHINAGCAFISNVRRYSLSSLVVIFLILSQATAFAESISNQALNERLSRLERLLENQNLLEMLSMLQSMQREVSEIRGNMEVLSHEMGILNNKQKDLYIDLDQRIVDLQQGLEKASKKFATFERGANPNLSQSSGAIGITSGVSQDVSDGVEESLAPQENYQSALSVLKDGRYKEAIEAFQVYMIEFPSSVYAGNAQYWMAEAYYVLKDYASAVAHFSKVINAYPESPKVPDAHLKLGFSYYEMKEWDSAKQVLEKVLTNFSNSTAARLADRRLQKMKLEGHLN